MRKTIFYLFILLPLLGFGQQWNQLGQILEGSGSMGGDVNWSANTIEFNAAGDIMAAGEKTYGNSSGRVRVFQFNGTEWLQIGQDILGVAAGDQSGSSVSLNAAGDILAVGAEYNDGNGNNSGQVRIFQYNGTEWIQLGEDIFGEAAGDRLKHVSLSEDGYTIAAVGTQAGHVRVFRYTDDIWVQLGEDIDGQEGDGSGFVSLSADGSIIGIGNDLHSGGAGQVRVFQYTDGDWIQLGQNINGNEGDRTGFSLDLSADGHIIAVSDYSNNGLTGRVRVLQFNTETSEWNQVGEPVIGNEFFDIFGYNVSLSADGSVLAVGAPGLAWFFAERGYIKTYINDNGTWSQLGETILGIESNGSLGNAVALNASGSIFAGGAPAAGGGHVVIYEFNCDLTPPVTEISSEICGSGTTLITVTNAEENITYRWFDSAYATIPVFTGTEFTTPALTETTSFWVDAYSAPCAERIEVVVTVNPLPELEVATISAEICEGTTIDLSADAQGNLVVWYNSPDATQWIATGNEYTTDELTETSSFWVQAYNPVTHCVSERIEIVVTVIPAPELTVETPEPEVCYGYEAELRATSPTNVIFWYANEEDEEYLYHGNLFVTPELTETTTYWAEAYNIITGCASERVEVTVTVNPIPDAPIAVSYQTVEEGTTLADLDVEAEGTLTWYANEALTVVLPETTLVEENTIYYVTQTIAGCESAAIEISVELLGLAYINGNSFAVYPNPTAGIVKIQSKTAVANIEVFNINGQRVTSVKAANEINISGYPSGTYLIRITLENGEVVTKKVVKK